MDLKIVKTGYYRLSAIMCEQDLKDLRSIMAMVSETPHAPYPGAIYPTPSIEERAVALRFKELMDKQREMPK